MESDSSYKIKYNIKGKYMYLEKINQTGDIKSIPDEMLEPLAEEIRTFLIEKISNVDWNKVSGKTVGTRFDFSV